MAELPLARDFPAAHQSDWEALVEQALKGAPLSTLQSRTYDGIVLEPLYARAPDARPLAARVGGAPWRVVQRVDLPDPVAANQQILDDLNNGASGLSLVFEGAVGDYGYALPPTPEAIALALEGVHLDAGISIDLDLGPACKDTALMLANLVGTRGTSPADAEIRFGFAPLSVLAANGWNAAPWATLGPIFAALVTELKAQGFAGPFAVGDGRPVHAAGGSEAQELAFALSAAVAYLRALESGGMSLEGARDAVYFRVAADQDQFLTIAKLRALRKLWTRVQDACGLDARPSYVAVETAWRMLTKRDPHGNIVRGTIAALAAAVGGADAIAVLPFSTALGVPESFARRIARNTQSILIEESNLHRVTDPSAGAGAIETLTAQLCDSAWRFFQEIEAAGGAAAALEQGLIQREVAKTREERTQKIATRRDPIIGTSDFPYLDEPAAPLFAAATAHADDAAKRMVEPLRRIRVAEPFEALRDKSDAALAQAGKRPTVFLACLGRPVDFSARAGFAKNVFEAGGIKAQVPDGVQTKDAMVAAFKSSGAKLACLCSSDKVYASEGVDAAKALKAAGAGKIYFAGKPSELESALRQAGVDDFVYQGRDIISLLHSAMGSGRQ